MISKTKYICNWFHCQFNKMKQNLSLWWFCKVSRETYRLVLIVIGIWSVSANRRKKISMCTCQTTWLSSGYERQNLPLLFLSGSESKRVRGIKGSVKTSDVFVLPLFARLRGKDFSIVNKVPDVYQNVKLESMPNFHASICDTYIFCFSDT